MSKNVNTWPFSMLISDPNPISSNVPSFSLSITPTLLLFKPLGDSGDEDPNMFEKFIEPEEYIDLGYLFIFSSKDELVDWSKQTAMNANTYLIITRYQRSRILDRRPYVTLACERGVNDEEEEILKKRRGPYGTKKFGCPFKLKGEQMATSENWQLFVHNGRHNHKITVYNHGHAQAARLTEEQLQ
ncbi:hypothetical protein M9H77_33817 [Catharanthus roseus]|uniref:Uncharacterized protein n=1 Tax=Catharanthus roseus TaxID=4058 RepID=A0ACB9ZJI2_CATRO|nr:hypothetical protein M9H77_33817 [Catharanthus roseus]